MKRDFTPDQPELMDLPQPVTPELRRDLANLVSLNRNFGSHTLIKGFIRMWLSPGRSYRILDLATGAGDIPRLIAAWAARHDVSVTIDAVDGNQSTLEIAKSLTPESARINWICADVLKYEPGWSYDLVCCSLALHHFSEDDAVALLRRCRELSHHYTLVSDLERCWSTYIGVWLVTALIYRDPMTKYDGRLSARRAFSYSEFRSLAAAAGWTDFGHDRFLFCRQAIWLVSQSLGDIPATVLEEGPVPCPIG